MTPNAEYRKAFLEEVIKTVCADRNITHGDAEDNFRTIGELWTTYLNARRGASAITSADVAAMMCLFKVARITANPANRDNWLDLAGYAACGAGVMKQTDKMPAPAEVYQERAAESSNQAQLNKISEGIASGKIRFC